MNANEMLILANNFHQIAVDVTDRVLGDDWKNDNWDFIVPQIVNISFACEIYLKALLTSKGIEYPTDRHGHELKSLYELLPDEIKCEVFKLLESNMDLETFQKWLDEINTSFNDWRYIFEHKKALNADILFWGNFTFAINTVAERIIQEKCAE